MTWGPQQGGYGPPPGGGYGPPMQQPMMQQPMGFSCPYCKATVPPQNVSKVSTVGWVIFVIMLCSFIGTLFCWIPLIAFKEHAKKCGACGVLLGGYS